MRVISAHGEFAVEAIALTLHEGMGTWDVIAHVSAEVMWNQHKPNMAGNRIIVGAYEDIDVALEEIANAACSTGAYQFSR